MKRGRIFIYLALIIIIVVVRGSLFIYASNARTTPDFCNSRPFYCKSNRNYYRTGQNIQHWYTYYRGHAEFHSNQPI